MKAFLLAAGKGTRLKPFTDRHPKCLIPIHGAPLLGIWIDLLSRHGVREVLVNLHHHAGQVRDFLSKRREDTDMVLHEFYEPQLRGSAGTVWDNLFFVEGDADFIVAYADNLTNLNLAKMIDFHRHIGSMGGVLTMGLIHAPVPSACGIASVTEQGRISAFIEKPEKPESDLANAGIYIASGAVFQTLEQLAPDHQGVFDWGHHVLPVLAGSMTLACMVLPTIIVASEEALRAVPQSIREASLALGATKWQTIKNHVLPCSIPGMITGSILGIGRAAGETAPILLTAAAFYLRKLPTSALDPVMALPYHLYVLATQHPDMAKVRPLQYGTALSLMLLVLGLSLGGIIWRSRLRKKYRW